MAGNKDENNFSLVVPQDGLGASILELSQQQLQKKMQEAVLSEVTQMISQKGNLITQVDLMNKQIKHIEQQITALSKNEFTLVRGKIKFNDAELDQDAARKLTIGIAPMGLNKTVSAFCIGVAAAILASLWRD